MEPVENLARNVAIGGRLDHPVDTPPFFHYRDDRILSMVAGLSVPSNRFSVSCSADTDELP